jgi:hypothetical protein
MNRQVAHLAHCLIREVESCSVQQPLHLQAHEVNPIRPCYRLPRLQPPKFVVSEVRETENEDASEIWISWLQTTN